MFCRSCGKTLPQDAKACPQCGTGIATPETSTHPSGSAAPTMSGTAAAPAPAPAQVALGKSIGQEVRARSKDAWEGIKLFAKSPVGGLQQSFEMFEPSRAMAVGVIFAVIYELLLFFGVYHAADKLASLFGGGLPASDLSIKQGLEIVFACAVPFITLTLSSMIARSVFRGKGSLAGDVYTAGASLLPLGLCVAVASFLGPANVEVIAALGVFALTYMILMLYAGCSRIAGIPETGAAPAVPIMLLLTIWLTKVVISAIFF
jgi:hypothetical protein